MKGKNNKDKRNIEEKDHLQALFTPQPVFCKSIYVQITYIFIPMENKNIWKQN